MQEIANKVVATCYHDELHEILSRYKKQLPNSQILLITHSALKEELNLLVEVNPALLSSAEEHLKQITSSGPSFAEKHALHGADFKYVGEDTLELPNVPAWIAEQMTESERAAFAKWYNKVCNEVEANKVGDTLKNG